ncbi:MAG: hypothetical protein EBX82_05300 [Actinobacteria bacterium]|nr:hypothetical protein [Actinomycetota bacterium]
MINTCKIVRPLLRADGIKDRELTASIAPATSNKVIAIKRSDGLFFKAINIQPKRVAAADIRASISPSSRFEISPLLNTYRTSLLLSLLPRAISSMLR